MKARSILTALALAGATGAVAAQTPASSGIYLGAGVGGSDYDVSGSDWGFGASTDDDTDTAWRVFAGMRLMPFLGAEIGYADLGKAKGTLGTRAEAEVIDLVAVGHVPLYQQGPHQFDLLGKLGGYWWDADVDALPGNDLDGSDDFDFTFGVGAQYHFNNIGTRVEWQRYQDVFGSVDTDVWMASVMFTF